jgi:hypothetical protein
VGLALVATCAYVVLHLQNARLTLTFGIESHVGYMRWGVQQLPRDVLHGVGPAPWQYRFVPYAIVGLLIEHGVPAILAGAAFKAVTLFAWLIVVQQYVSRWFPSQTSRALATMAVTLLAMLSIPWFIYNLEDFGFLAAATFATHAALDKRFVRFVLAATVATVFKEVGATLILVWVLTHRSWQMATPGRWARIAVAGSIIAAPAVLAFLLLHPTYSETHVHFPENFDVRAVNVIPLAILFLVSLPGVRAPIFRYDLYRLLPYFALHIAECVVFGEIAEIRIWYLLSLLAIPLLLRLLRNGDTEEAASRVRLDDTETQTAAEFGYVGHPAGIERERSGTRRRAGSAVVAQK